MFQSKAYATVLRAFIKGQKESNLFLLAVQHLLLRSTGRISDYIKGTALQTNACCSSLISPEQVHCHLNPGQMNSTIPRPRDKLI